MSRRVIWSAVVAAALCVLAALWFLDNFERVPVKTYESTGWEARRNPYLAAERLFSRLGRTVTRVRRPAALDALDEDGALILERGHRRAVDEERAERLLEWTARGGYLIVEAEFSGDDPLLKAFGVACTCRRKDAEPDGDDEEEDTEPGDDDEEDAEPYDVVVLPDRGGRYRLSSGSRGLSTGDARPEWRAAGRNGNVILHYAHRRGNVTVVSRLSFLDNWNLGDFDHAELAWALLQRYQPGGAIYLAGRLEHPTLWQWLAESAWRALVSAAALVVLWLWSVVPRFGGLRTSPDAARRDLAQHLLAIGRSLWREGGLGHLRELARREIAQRLALRHPTLARRLSGERHAALARIAGLDGRKIREALADEQTPTPESFTRAMQTLQRLEHKL